MTPDSRFLKASRSARDGTSVRSRLLVACYLLDLIRTELSRKHTIEYMKAGTKTRPRANLALAANTGIGSGRFGVFDGLEASLHK